MQRVLPSNGFVISWIFILWNGKRRDKIEVQRCKVGWKNQKMQITENRFNGQKLPWLLTYIAVKFGTTPEFECFPLKLFNLVFSCKFLEFLETFCLPVPASTRVMPYLMLNARKKCTVTVVGAWYCFNHFMNIQEVQIATGVPCIRYFFVCLLRFAPTIQIVDIGSTSIQQHTSKVAECHAS